MRAFLVVLSRALLLWFGILVFHNFSISVDKHTETILNVLASVHQGQILNFIFRL